MANWNQISIVLFIIFTCTSSKIIFERDFRLSSLEEEPNRHAKLAREVVHKSEWAAFGTISVVKEIHGFPMVNIISVADSPKGEKSTGNVYFFLTPLDYSTKDLLKDNKLTVMFSNDEDLSCQKKGIDPMEPVCPRVVFSGSAYQLEKDADEYKFANKSFFSHHPAAENWVNHTVGHNFFLCKLNISFVSVLDGYGGPHILTPEEYFNVELESNEHLTSSKSDSSEEYSSFELNAILKHKTSKDDQKKYKYQKRNKKNNFADT